MGTGAYCEARRLKLRANGRALIEAGAPPLVVAQTVRQLEVECSLSACEDADRDFLAWLWHPSLSPKERAVLKRYPYLDWLIDDPDRAGWFTDPDKVAWLVDMFPGVDDQAWAILHRTAT